MRGLTVESGTRPATCDDRASRGQARTTSARCCARAPSAKLLVSVERIEGGDEFFLGRTFLGRVEDDPEPR